MIYWFLRYLEVGEKKGNWYGTSVDSVKEVINSGCTCLLKMHPQSLRAIRTAEYRPYIIFIKPPHLGILKATREACHAKYTPEDKPPRPFTVSNTLRTPENLQSNQLICKFFATCQRAKKPSSSNRSLTLDKHIF